MGQAGGERRDVPDAGWLPGTREPRIRAGVPAGALAYARQFSSSPQKRPHPRQPELAAAKP
jgi:hypothetical protein